MRYLIVIPTIRTHLRGFEPTMAAVRESLTQPTDFHVLDGAAGKTQTLTKAFDELLGPWDGDIYVTMDDDVVPPMGWQDAIDAAFKALPEVGMLSVWLGEGAVEQRYMDTKHIGPEQERSGVRYRMVLRNHHIPGFLLAFRREVAESVGKLPESDLKYQIWEDAWRGRSVLKQGFKLAYVVTDQPPILVVYVDDDSYVQSKSRELASGRLIEDEMLHAGGVGDSFMLRLRKRVARLRGRG